ncbi:polysaccharide deacetylase family protein [Rhodoferax antarcticus]|uniref:polysaccharide deacetylase family protein n=1 Tax=Rhodoferax antarcticus TaxID=81479 RepID=UPI00222558DF|nr:polysaccharide deacetylase family protein [Rhodoferax antarcticus]MCW2313654.1 peptidoglycan/xylan/chitin deacetylase (PgdA/CDA1 family)/glycosyltransferase involved in cell wall biosynthesis [Rhodoferax antarcticus]
MFEVLSRGKLTTLLFHKVPQVRHPLMPAEPALADFSAILDATLRRFRVLPLEDAVNALRAGNLPANSACITFDDGYPDWRTGVLPVLESRDVHATFFITAGQFNDLPMWNEHILHAVNTAPPATQPLRLPGLPALSFATQQDRQIGVALLDEHLKYQAPAVQAQLLDLLDQHTGFDRKQIPTMSVEDLRYLHAKGFGIGGHSVTHPILSRCTPQQAFEEIAGAREQLESLIRGKVTSFAYPNGTPGKDFGREHIEMVHRAGYRYAVTTHRGVASANTPLMQIPRFTPWGPSARRMDLQFLRNMLQRNTLIPEDATNGRRALMVAFHFPPQSGSSGILRTLNFVKNLSAAGWNSSVLTATPGVFEEQSNDLVASIPSTTHVVRATALDAARHLSIGGKYPRVFALPDRWSSWWLPAVWAGMREIRHTRPDLIWSTYPFATAHMIGGALCRLSGLPWVADFRDPMIRQGHPTDPLQLRVWHWLEAQILQHAAACVFTTPHAAKTYRQRYPAHAGKCHVIENGFDEAAFEQAVPSREGVAPERLLLLHSGLIYPEERDPSTFFAAVRALIDTGELDFARLCIRFRAPRHDAEVLAYAASYGLQACVQVAPPIPYQNAIAEMMGADLLLVFQGSIFNTQIPAKIYEYLRAQRPVFAVLDPVGGTAAQLRRFEAVFFADIASTDAIRSALQHALAALQSDDQPAALQRNRDQVMVYSRKAQTVRLQQLFDELVNARKELVA